MAEDATIYLHIDWKMGHYVKVVMDELFGQNHFINDIARIKCNPKNFERKAFGNIKDMILVYSKTSNYIWNESVQEYSPPQLRGCFPKKTRKEEDIRQTRSTRPGKLGMDRLEELGEVPLLQKEGTGDTLPRCWKI